MNTDRVCVCHYVCDCLSRGFRVCLGAFNRPKLQRQFRLLGNFKKTYLVAVGGGWGHLSDPLGQ